MSTVAAPFLVVNTKTPVANCSWPLLMEPLLETVTVVEGEPTNIKLTTEEDLQLLDAILRRQEAGKEPAAAAPRR